MTTLQRKFFRLPPEHYTKVLSDYRDWRFAWIREVLQNSIDAKSNEISFSVKDIDENLTEVVIKDNGNGMNRDVLENGFMSLGGSFKDENSLGGFGVASMMIAQSHESYEIVSDDYICKGSKGSYTIEDYQNYQKGCLIKVIMRKSDIISNYSWRTTVDIFRDNVTQWSNFAFVNGLKIDFNGEDLSPENRTFKYKISSDIGEISFDDSEHGAQSILYIRMKKQPMFSHKVYTDHSAFIGVIDLDGESVDYLTSNRDGLSREKSTIITKVLNSLSNERGKYKLGKMESFTLNAKSIDSMMDESIAVEIKEAVEKKIQDLPESERKQESILKSLFEDEKENFESIKEKIVKKISKIKNDYYPNNFNIKFNTYTDSDKTTIQKMTELTRMLNQKRFQKLSWNWEYLVGTVLDTMVNTEYHMTKIGNNFLWDGKAIKFGFVFNNDVEGLCEKSEDDIIIYINPNISLDFDIESLLDVAIHESTHLDVDTHGEYFTIQETKIRRNWRKYNKISDSKKALKSLTI